MLENSCRVLLAQLQRRTVMMEALWPGAAHRYHIFGDCTNIKNYWSVFVVMFPRLPGSLFLVFT